MAVPYVCEKRTYIYIKKSLRTKEQALAEERAEDLYIEIRNDMKLGKSFFAISIKEGVQMYLDYRKQDVGVADVGIVEGRYRRGDEVQRGAPN